MTAPALPAGPAPGTIPAVERTVPTAERSGASGERAAGSGWLPGSRQVDGVVEAVLVLLVAASALRYLVRHPWSGTSAAVVLGAAVLAAGYAAGRWVPARHRRGWLGAVCLLWLGLVLVAPSFGWCAVALAFAALRVLPYRAAVVVVVGLVVAVSSTWLRLTDRDPTVVVGPVCLAVLAVGAYRALERDAEVQRAVLADLRSAQDELAAAERREGALAERHRLSREIHDSVGQDLSSIVLLLQASDQDWGLRPDAAREHVRQAAASARAGLTEVRRVVHDLGPEAGGEQPLEQVLRQVAERVSRGAGLPVRVQVSGEQVPLPADVETALLRTARGALANVVEHARATQAVVTLTYLDDQVSLDVCDDGQGLPPAARGRSRTADRTGRGLGLWAIRDRVDGLGGSLVVESTPGSGTALAVTLPTAAGVRA
jgi:signal transduction histidine kinase